MGEKEEIQTLGIKLYVVNRWIGLNIDDWKILGFNWKKLEAEGSNLDKQKSQNKHEAGSGTKMNLPETRVQRAHLLCAFWTENN